MGFTPTSKAPITISRAGVYAIRSSVARLTNALGRVLPFFLFLFFSLFSSGLIIDPLSLLGFITNIPYLSIFFFPSLPYWPYKDPLSLLGFITNYPHFFFFYLLPFSMYFRQHFFNTFFICYSEKDSFEDYFIIFIPLFFHK